MSLQVCLIGSPAALTISAQKTSISLLMEKTLNGWRTYQKQTCKLMQAKDGVLSNKGNKTQPLNMPI